MTSEDVIHCFFVPAFRIKADVLPGRYTTVWFEADQDRHATTCSAREYCGTKHSGMIGDGHRDGAGRLPGVARRRGVGGLAGRAGAEDVPGPGLHHRATGATRQGRGPSLEGVFGSKVPLDDGQTVVADEAYIRESILSPTREDRGRLPAVMPTFQGLVSEEQLLTLHRVHQVAEGTGEPAGLRSK